MSINVRYVYKRTFLQTRSNNMELNTRQQEILDILYETGKVSVAELSKRLYVAEMTIRRDLTAMEKGGFLRRYHGGAVLMSSQGKMPLSHRIMFDENEKKALSKKCIKYLKDNMTVFIDSSSTCQYIIPHIATFKNMKIVTNSVKALLTASSLHIPCILIGGDYYEQDMCLIGSIAERYAKELNVDISFFTTAAYSEDGIISDFDEKQLYIRKIMLENSSKSVFLFEKSKIGKKMLHTLCRSEDATDVLTVEEV